jgi:hypothetical protein
MDLRAQIDTNTVLVGDMNTTLTPVDRSSRQKINKEASEHTLDPVDTLDIYAVFYPTTI